MVLHRAAVDPDVPCTAPLPRPREAPGEAPEAQIWPKTECVRLINLDLNFWAMHRIRVT